MAMFSRSGITPGVTFRPVAPVEDALPYCAVWLPGNDNPALHRLISLARSMSQDRMIPVTPAIAS